MPARFQLVVDCKDPEVLARFWAAALGYVLEPPPEVREQYPGHSARGPQAARRRRGQAADGSRGHAHRNHERRLPRSHILTGGQLTAQRPTSRSALAATSGSVSLDQTPAADSVPARNLTSPGARPTGMTCRCRA